MHFCCGSRFCGGLYGRFYFPHLTLHQNPQAKLGYRMALSLILKVDYKITRDVKIKIEF